MRILVIGGTGFLSKAVAIEALAGGHEVSVVTRGRRPPLEGTRAITADRNDTAAFAAALGGLTFDLVIDCIGFNATHAQQDVAVFGARARHLVFISTDFVYDPSDRPWRIDETYDRFEQAIDYGRQKREAECVLIDAARCGGGMAITILRPCHIYGPDAHLGCLPNHGRDPELLDRLRRGETLTLVGGGYFLQQPVAATDIAKMALSCFGNAVAHGEIYLCAGPDVVDSRGYYRILADALGVSVTFDEASIDEAIAEKPERRPFFAHRVYDLGKAKRHELMLPATPLRDGLTACVRAKI